MEAVRTSETSVDNHFTRQYNPEDSSEKHYNLQSKAPETLSLSVNIKLVLSRYLSISATQKRPSFVCSALKMETIFISETLATTDGTTRSQNTKHHHHQTNVSETLKSHTIYDLPSFAPTWVSYHFAKHYLQASHTQVQNCNHKGDVTLNSMALEIYRTMKKTLMFTTEFHDYIVIILFIVN
jgi:hypothetical protein